MRKYVLRQAGLDLPVGKFESKIGAVGAMNEIIEENNDSLDCEDDNYLTPFDFTIEKIEREEINEEVTSYEEARSYLGGKPNADFTVSKKILSGNSVNLKQVNELVNDTNPKHIKALIALNKLFTIAQAWNKADEFVPDFSNLNQEKWFPWFIHNSDAEGFVFGYEVYSSTYAYAHFGSRICFKTPSRARQFGEQFIDLWNDVLLFR